MHRRVFLFASLAILLLTGGVARAAVSAGDAQAFINGLGADAIGALTGSSLSTADRESRFDTLLKANFDMPGISKFVLGRYWKIATPDQQTEFQSLLEKLLTQSYAKAFAQYSGQKFTVQGTRSNDDGSTIVNSTILQPNGDVIRLDWRVEDVAGKTLITDLFVEGVSLRTTHRSDFASAIQSNGGTVKGLLDALRQKVNSQQ
jgi:phospholipid transport system substrate-binding protein